ncbi:MAG: tripartite tricarboxylate transporter TctB family protein [Rhodobacteraceae bacterium]|nr:MAG: tripartite tricarboxylate transporter TctB family protein [Paracoccaceae bacterium]
MIRSNVIAGVICLAFAIFVYWLAGGVPAMTATDNLGGRFFPRLIAVAMMIASIGLIVTGWIGIEISGGTAKGGAVKSADTETAPPESGPEFAETGQRYLGRFGPGELRLGGFVVVMAAYTMILPVIGYIPSSIVAFAALIAIAGERRPLRVALGAVGITALLFVLFAIVFQMSLPGPNLF